MKACFRFGVLGLAIFAVLCAGMAGAQGAAAVLTPTQALGNLSTAAGEFKGTRAQHIALQQSIETLAAVVTSYEQYLASLASRPAAAKRKGK